jgi:hypothetical protein
LDISRGDDTDLQENDNNAEIMRVEFDVEDGDAELDRVKIDFEFTGKNNGEDKPWNVFEDIKLLSNGDVIGTINGGDEDEWDNQGGDTYEITFDNLSELIRENDSADLTLEVDVQNSIDGANNGDVSYDVFVPDEGIRAFDDINDSFEIGDEGDTINIDISND